MTKTRFYENTAKMNTLIIFKCNKIVTMLRDSVKVCADLRLRYALCRQLHRNLS
jgi:hypothetical protein